MDRLTHALPRRETRSMTTRHAPAAVAGLFLTALVGARPALGYSVPNHEALTRFAVKQIDFCVAKHPDLAPGHVSAGLEVCSLVECNAAQDGAFEKIALWHFYSPDKELRSWLPIARDTKLDNWFAILSRELEASTKQPATAHEIVGALIHYLQDVTVPAHVLPIFHVPPMSDKFDKEAFHEPTLIDDKEKCRALLDSKRLVNQILFDTAFRTRRSLDQRLPKAGQTAATWEVFWNPEPKKSGFAKYGCAKNRFGEAGPIRCKGMRVQVT